MKRRETSPLTVIPPSKRPRQIKPLSYTYCTQCKMTLAQYADGQTMHPAVAYLCASEGNADNQKSDDWLHHRRSKATGTFMASCLPQNHANFNTYAPRTCAFLNKLNLGLPFTGNDATRHGERFEDTAIEIYRRLVNQDQVQSFGLLQHPTVSWLGGSPDGITNGGIVLEVKCPFYRWLKKDGYYPAYYYPQPQLLLEITGLEVAHFIQFKPPVIRKEVVGSKTVIDKYTQKPKTVDITSNVYEDNIENMLKYGHDEERYVEPLVFSVVEVVRNRQWYYENVKYVREMWHKIENVYSVNKVLLGDANMIRALYADRMSLQRYVVRMLQFCRHSFIPLFDVVAMLFDKPRETWLDMESVDRFILPDSNESRSWSTLYQEKANRPKALFDMLRKDLASLVKFYTQEHHVTYLNGLTLDAIRDGPPFFEKRKVLNTMANYLTADQLDSLKSFLYLDSPVVDDIAAFCQANDIAFTSVKQYGHVVTTKAFDLDKIKEALKRKMKVYAKERTLDVHVAREALVEPDVLGQTIYYRCGSYAYNPRHLHADRLDYFGQALHAQHMQTPLFSIVSEMPVSSVEQFRRSQQRKKQTAT